ncbi:MAG: F0F1 ATP synthase subunit B [Flavobacteriales bacterium]
MEQLINDFSLGLFVWQAIFLLVLILLMVKFAWKPIMASLDSREEGIKNALESAEKAKEEMANISANNEKILKEAKAERDAVLKEAREMKAEIVAKAQDTATAEADRIMAQAQEAIVAERSAAVAEMKNHMAKVSIDIAEKVLKSELADKTKQTELVNSLLNDVNLN